MPVLFGANKLNLEALRGFCDGAIQELPVRQEALLEWVNGS